MDETALLQELEALAEELAIEVRYDTLEGLGGLCRYGGKAYLILNRDSNNTERLNAFARAFSRLSLDAVFVRPQVREFIEENANDTD
ncbi:MAG: hypothetical protein ACI906_002791 [Candidatus Latescibacterota bacterium]|jgi:hypothetical protein